MMLRRLARLPGLLRRVSRLPGRDQALLLEALVLLAFAAPAIRLLPFKTVGRIASMPLRRPAPTDAAKMVERIAWAVGGVSSRAPWHSMCFQEGLAAQIMLRRRGIPGRLYYGAAPNRLKEGVMAHVWVMADDRDVIGQERKAEFAVLAVFPQSNVSAL